MSAVRRRRGLKVSTSSQQRKTTRFGGKLTLEIQQCHSDVTSVGLWNSSGCNLTEQLGWQRLIGAVTHCGCGLSMLGVPINVKIQGRRVTLPHGRNMTVTECKCHENLSFFWTCSEKTQESTQKKYTKEINRYSKVKSSSIMLPAHSWFLISGCSRVRVNPATWNFFFVFCKLYTGNVSPLCCGIHSLKCETRPWMSTIS